MKDFAHGVVQTSRNDYFFHSSHVNMYFRLHLLFLKQNHNVPGVVNSMRKQMPPLSLSFISFTTTNKTTVSSCLKTQDKKYPVLKKFPFSWVFNTEKTIHSKRANLISSLTTAKHIVKYFLNYLQKQVYIEAWFQFRKSHPAPYPPLDSALHLLAETLLRRKGPRWPSRKALAAQPRQAVAATTVPVIL